MNKELRILVLEDVAADVVLISHELRAGGLAFQTKRVETREEFERELAQNPPDVILSDHGLPAFDGFSALAIARERCPETPFIFVTGSMGEELAIDSLRSGAIDYVLKTRMSNLVPAVERALRLADERTKRKQAQKELRDSEERFRLLVSGVKDYAIFMLDPDGKISSWNAGAELVLGHSAREVIGQHFRMFYRPQDRDAGKPESDLTIADAEGRFEDEGWRLHHGEPFWAHVDIRALRDNEGKLRGFTQVTRDATERRRHQESLRKSEERYRRLVELCPDALIVLSHEQIAFVNSAAQKLLGASEPEQLLGKPFLQFLAPESREDIGHRLKEITARGSAAPWGGTAATRSHGGHSGFTEETLQQLDGSEVMVEMAATRLTFEDEPAVQVLLHDVTSLKEASEALRESEARKAAILETSLDAVVSFDHKGVVREWNSAAEKMFGYRREQTLGNKLESLIVPNALTEKYLPGLADYLMNGVTSLIGRAVEVMARRSNGDTFPVELALTQIPASDPPFFTAFIRDITDRKQSEEALRRSESRKAAVLETALDAIVSIDEQGKIIEWNPAAERIFGYTRELALGREMAELIIPATNTELHRKGLARYLQTGRGRMLGHRTEMMALRANGAEFPVEITITRIPGAPLVFTSFIRDITERRRTEEALRKSEERFRLLVEGVDDYAIFMLDTHGRITTWNAGAERIEGYRAPEIIGRRFHRFYAAEDVERKKPDQALTVATAEGRFHDERWLVRKDGTRFWAAFVITALRDENGKLTGFSTIARDITKRKQAEDEIRRLNTELERQVQERTTELQAAYQEMEAFSYSISHDLRAPLIHIAGFVEMLKSDLGPKLDEKSSRHLQTICDSTEHMGRMIADLLTFSRVGRAEMHKVRVNLTDLVKDVQRELQPLLQNRKVTWAIAPAMPEVLADPFLLRQAIANLLVNAVKFTRPREEAKIEVGADFTDRETIFYVRDNGAGFDMKYGAKLFGVFQRLHSVSEFEGTGIGLANVRRIIQRHGGRTWAEGTPGQGATFFFSLPEPQDK